jgi:competence protein ComEC
VRAGEQELLLPGDVEARAEADMLDAAQLSTSTVVVAPHHGSRTSSTPSFVAATRPQWVVYAAGHRNRWHFPVTAIVERWEQAGARGLMTSTSGAISFTLRPGEVLPEPGQWRLERPPPWRDP